MRVVLRAFIKNFYEPLMNVYKFNLFIFKKPVVLDIPL